MAAGSNGVGIVGVEKYYENFEPPPEAPTFTPDEDEFKDPLSYIAKIKPIAERYGVVKIKPPESWQPPFVIDIDKFVFTPRLQKLNELEALSRVRLNFLDAIARFWHLQGSQLRVPIMDGRPVDLFKLRKLVHEIGGYDAVCTAKKWTEMARKLGLKNHRGPVLREHYDRILLPFDIYQSGLALQHANSAGKPQSGRASSVSPMKAASRAPLRHRSRMTCATTSTTKLETDGSSVKMEPDEKLDNDPCSSTTMDSQNSANNSNTVTMKNEDGGVRNIQQQQLLSTPKKAGVGVDGKEELIPSDPMDIVYCKICNGGEDEDLLLLCDTCDQSFHTYCLLPPLQGVPRGDWRCPKCITDEVQKPSEAYGFSQAERNYTLNSFGEMADKFKTDYFGMPCHMVPLSSVEKEFWRLVAATGDGVTVEYGADLLTDEVGSGFPRRQNVSSPNVNGSPLSPEDEAYVKSPWNLNNLPSLPNSVLSHISVDISGMKVPWVYVGMCFSTFCWHTEDHWSYSINYLHWGEPKTWYGVSGLEAEQFEKAMKDIAPELFAEQPDLLHHLVTMTNPRLLMDKGVKIYTINQCAGEFVVTFPRAYHAGFNQGYNFAEAVNFCPSDWLSVGRSSMMHYAKVRRLCVFAHDELICKIAAAADLLDMDVCAATNHELALMIDDEKSLRHKAHTLGVASEEQYKFEGVGDDERLCKKCRTTCFSSAIVCRCETDNIVCLRNLESICQKCTPSKCTLRYRYTIDELEGFLLATEQRTAMYDSWKEKVLKYLACGSSSLEEKPTLGDLKQLTDEAKREHYPQHSGLMTKVTSAVKHADRCANVAEQLIMQKIRTRQRQKNTLEGFSRKLRLDEVETFVQQLSSLVCRIPQAEAIMEFIEKVKQFKIEAAEPSSIADISHLSNLLERGSKFDLQLPEIPKLKQAMDKKRWMDSVDSVVTAVDNGKATRNDLSRMRNLLDEGVNLVAAGVDIEQSLAKLQSHLVALENDDVEVSLIDNSTDTVSVALGSGTSFSGSSQQNVKRSGNAVPNNASSGAKRFRTSKQSRANTASAQEDDQRCSAGTCLQPSGDEVNWVQCEGGCDQWFHIVCVDLTLQSLDAIDRYTCQKCVNSLSTAADVAANGRLSNSSPDETDRLVSSSMNEQQQQQQQITESSAVETVG